MILLKLSFGISMVASDVEQLHIILEDANIKSWIIKKISIEHFQIKIELN